MPIDKICQLCGNHFFVSPCNINQKYCSAKCYGATQQGRNVCTVEGCNNFVVGFGYCNKHYLKFKKYDSPTFTKQRIYCGTRGRKVLTENCLYCGNAIEKPTYKRKYCSKHCSGKANTKPFIVKKGYKKVLIPSHPRADSKGYVFEHIVIMESILGRALLSGEVCHHIDGNKLNNCPSNLTTFINNSEHIKHHVSLISK